VVYPIGTVTGASGQIVTHNWTPSDQLGYDCGSPTVKLKMKVKDADGETAPTVVHNVSITYGPC